MRAAPPVGVTCPAASAWRLARALLTGAVAAVLLAWAGLHLQAPAAPLLAMLGGLLVAGWAWRLGAGTPRALRWDGQRWTVDGRPAEVDVMMDLGRWLLLRARFDAGVPQWLPLSRAQAGPSWVTLRAALYARTAAPRPAGPWHE